MVVKECDGLENPIGNICIFAKIVNALIRDSGSDASYKRTRSSSLHINHILQKHSIILFKFIWEKWHDIARYIVINVESLPSDELGVHEH
jgi:hypothetical protein